MVSLGGTANLMSEFCFTLHYLPGSPLGLVLGPNRIHGLRTYDTSTVLSICSSKIRLICKTFRGPSNLLSSQSTGIITIYTKQQIAYGQREHHLMGLVRIIAY